MLDLARLRILRAVSTYGSVSAAADALHVTTSAISQQMRTLERETGQRLLDRQGRGVKLTDAAKLLVQHAEKILSLVEEAEAELESRKDAVSGTVAIGAFPTASRGLAPGALVSLAAAYPQLQVELREMEPTTSVPMVSRGDLDLAVVQDWFNAPMSVPDGLVRSPLMDDVADVALPARHPLASKKVLALKDLAGEVWIRSKHGSICHDWLVHTLRTQGAEPKFTHSASEYPTQLALVAAGLGACVVPRLGRGAVPDNVRMVRVEPGLSRHIYAVWRADAARRPALRVIVAALRKAAERCAS